MSRNYLERAHRRYQRCRKQLVKLCLLALLIVGCATAAAARQEATGSGPCKLTQGFTVARQLAGGESQICTVDLRTGWFIQLVVEQKGIDVRLTASGPDDKPRVSADRPNGTRGPEMIAWVADVAGPYVLKIQALEPKAPRGDYEVNIKVLREARPGDEKYSEAINVQTAAEDARNRPTAVSLGEAVSGFADALKRWQELNELYEMAIAHYGLGWSHNVLCEYEEAIAHFDASLQIMTQQGDEHGEAITRTGLAYALMYLGDNSRALENFERALELRRLQNNVRGEAAALFAIGSVHSLLGHQQEALNKLLQSLTLREKAQDRLGEAITLAGIGKTYRRLERYQEALYYLGRALVVIKEVNNRPVEADTLANLGWVRYSLQQYDLAAQSFSQALPLTRLVGDIGGEAMTLYGIARVEERNGDLLQAREHMEAALNIIESLRTKVTSQQLRTSYFASVQDYYAFYIDLLMSLHQASPRAGFDTAALQASERARARTLLDILVEARANIRQGVPPTLLEREQKVQKQLNSKIDYHLRLQSAPAPPADQITAVQKEIASLREEYDEVQRQIRKSSPRYASLAQPTPLSLSEIQHNVLDDDTALLEYTIGGSNCYLWVVTHDSVLSLRLANSPREVTTAAQAFINMLTQVGGTTRSVEFAADGLTKMLLPEFTNAVLRGKKRLILVADGILQSLPFNALAVPNSHTYSPLVTSYEILSLPSVSTLDILRREALGRASAPKAAIVLADPVFTDADKRVHKSNRSGGGTAATRPQALDGATPPPQSETELARILSLGDENTRSGIHLLRLLATRREAFMIKDIVPGTRVAVDFDANLATATSPELGNYRVIHFATHGIAPDQHPELSGIVLSLVDRRGRTQEGYLSLPMVYNLKLPADMVVLSACETGLGEDVQGEGLISLTRGFMHAGATRVVASLWKVREGATAELMRRFYTALYRQGMRPSAALSYAEASMWKEQKWAPSDWSGFMFFGDWK